MGDLTFHFDREELKCPCCGKIQIDQSFINMLEEARIFAGVPFVINSGYRCHKHNTKVGSETNNHPSGAAADILCANGPTRRKILKGLVFAGFERIGIGRTYIHADNMDKLAGSPRSYWLY